MSRSESMIGMELAQGLSLGFIAVALCLCLRCVNRGQDLAAAYWAMVVFVVPRMDRWLRERA